MRVYVLSLFSKSNLLAYTRWLGDSVVSIVAHGPSGREFDAHSPCAPVAQWGVTHWTANNSDSRHVSVLGRPDCLLTMVVLRPTQPSIPPGSVNKDQLWLGRRSRYGWQVKLCDFLITRVIPVIGLAHKEAPYQVSSIFTYLPTFTAKGLTSFLQVAKS